MPAAADSISFSLALQIGAALLITFLLFHFRSRFEKNYLLVWARSWAALAFFYCGLALNLYLAKEFSASHPLRILSSIGAATAGFFQVGLLAWGSYELTRQRPLKIRDSKVLMIAVGVVGVVVALLLTALPDEMRFQTFFHAGVRSLISGLAFLGSGYALLNVRARRGSIGFTLASGAFVLYGISQLVYCGLALYWISRGLAYPYALPLAFGDVSLQLAAGMGMIIGLLEDEREAAMNAASQVEHLAYHDPLTGLPNRSLFLDRLVVALSHASRHRYKLAVLFLDLDRFKQINDSLGHSMGDELLRTASQRIKNCIRAEDTVARFAGDEFTILIHIIGRAEDAGKIGRKILDAMSMPFFLGDREVVVTSSVGIAIYPNDGLDAETLVKNADVAMYRAKQEGRDNCQFYTPAMNSKAMELLEIEAGLRKALANHELILHYQPLIDLQSGTIYGLEALLRWNHPTLGVLPPDKFISTAETSGLIIPIGNWVIREACGQAKTWQRDKSLDLLVSVNLSARQFRQPDLIDQVKAALEESRLAPRYLELEITESSAMQDVQQTIRVLNDLKSLGVRISIDDFGTGYSSLTYLKEFPVDTLKLDQSFVRDLITPTDAAIVSGVIAMAHSMSLKVMAEGVESLGQLDFLKANACDRLQGFLFSRPLSSEAFEKFIDHNRSLVRVA